MSDAQQPPTNGSDANPPPQVQSIGQYVKDLSFENPGAAMNIATRPQIDLNVDLQARRLEPPRFEVDLKLRVSAKAEDRPIFLLELIYTGVFAVQNVADDLLQQVLLIEAPHLLFPFARRIVADVVRDGGMPPLMLEPIDFANLYKSRAAELQQQLAASKPAGL